MQVVVSAREVWVRESLYDKNQVSCLVPQCFIGDLRDDAAAAIG